MAEAHREYKYDWDEFVIPSRDQKGMSSRAIFRIQPGHQRQAEIFLASRRFPYRTIGDLFRHAIDRHLKYLQSLEPGDLSMLGAVDQISYMIRDDQFWGEMEGVFKSMADRTQMYLDRGDYGDARRIMAQIRTAIDDIPDYQWRVRYRQRFTQQFGSFLTPGEAAPKVVTMLGTVAATGTGPSATPERRPVMRGMDFEEQPGDEGWKGE